MAVIVVPAGLAQRVGESAPTIILSGSGVGIPVMCCCFRDLTGDARYRRAAGQVRRGLDGWSRPRVADWQVAATAVSVGVVTTRVLLG